MSELRNGPLESINLPHNDHPPNDLEPNRHILKSRDLVLDCRLPVVGGAHIMGVLNVTPDSFSDGGKYLSVARAVARATEMAHEGAQIIDIGGASSRPKGSAYGAGAEIVSLEEELRRVLPVVKELVTLLPDVWISIDTYRMEVARAALEMGAHMINDITALRFEPQLAEVCAAFNAPLVLMHSVGLPGDMPHGLESSSPKEDIVKRVRTDLEVAINVGIQSGCRQLIVDPGFGFGKQTTENLRLIAELQEFQSLGYPLLIGVSRKSSVGEILSSDGKAPPPEDRVFGSLGITAVGLNGGASIVRTHDVRETSQFLMALDATRRTSKV